eukprot:3859606-Alexandrium_andersonii.AAC.1
MFPAKAAFPDLATSAAAAKATSKRDKKQAAAVQPQLRAIFKDIVDKKGGAPADGGGAQTAQNVPTPPADGGSAGSGAPKSSWGP